MRGAIKSMRVVIMAMSAVFVILPAAYGEIIFDGSPGMGVPPPELGTYPMTPFHPDPRPIYEDVVSMASPLGGDLGFSIPLSHRRIGQGWATWSHGYVGDVYWTNYHTSVSLTLPPGTTAFYFYVEQNTFKIEIFEAIADGGTSSGSINIDTGHSGATYFGFYSTDGEPIHEIEITCTSGVDFAIGEFGISKGAPLCPCSEITAVRTFCTPGGKPVALVQSTQAGEGGVCQVFAGEAGTETVTIEAGLLPGRFRGVAVFSEGPCVNSVCLPGCDPGCLH